MRSLYALSLSATILLLPAIAHADATQKPGRWMEKISIKMTGMSAKEEDDLKKGGMGAFLTGEPMENKDCVRAPGKTLKAIATQATDGMFDKSCAMGTMSESGGTLTVEMACPAVKGKGHGEYTLTDTSLTGKFTMDQTGPAGTAVHTDIAVDSKFVQDSCK